MSKLSSHCLREKLRWKHHLADIANHEIDAQEDPPEEIHDLELWTEDDWDDLHDAYEDYDPYEEAHSWDLDDDYDWMEAIDGGRVGEYVKDETRTYLCARVHGCIVYINVLTGEQEKPNMMTLERVG